MHCAYCSHTKTVIISALWDSRHKTIRRFRKCPKCDYRWSTLEIDLDQAKSLEALSEKRLRLPEKPQKPRSPEPPPQTTEDEPWPPTAPEELDGDDRSFRHPW
ncbi:MAG: hypothetical protein Unbinned5784contig1000_41 [Prokaryotic dsDNA virus sp.]|nr:MAG: hypothetical protein Unbinned5784contig1000_41 [Prokaryotic dsDNA virus sp.]|tara:strand:- start:749 stop:1057 length:309 start_codon:yes stop_codon:yes gene_type:complete